MLARAAKARAFWTAKALVAGNFPFHDSTPLEMARMRNVQTIEPHILKGLIMSSFNNDPSVIIHQIAFLRDLNSVLHPNFPTLSKCQLGEAIANGLDFNTLAALREAFKASSPLKVVIQDQRFCKRLQDFQTFAPEGLFREAILSVISGPNADILIGYQGEQRKALSRVKVRLKRLLSDEEAERTLGIDFGSFVSVFREHATQEDPMVVIAINLGDSVDIGGYEVSVGSDNDWLVVVDPAT